MRVEVEAVRQVTDELVDAAGRLLPQLSSSAAPLAPDDLARITSHDGVTLFVARGEDAIVGMLTLVRFPLPSGLRPGSRMSSSTRTPAATGSGRR